MDGRRATVPERQYLIIGNSAGGVAAAEAIREVDGEGAITIVSEERYPAYSRPLVSEYLAGERSLDSILLRPADFYERNKIEALLGTKAAHIDFDRRLVELTDGRRLAWRKLLLATGGAPIVPKLKGSHRQGMFTFTTLEDAERIGQALTRGCTAVVVGGGLIGVSLTQALVQRGVTVVIMELMDRLLSTALDAEASRLVEQALRAQGVEIILGQTAREIVGRPEDNRRVGGVILEGGRTIACDGVVFAIGVAPRTELVRESPVALNRGIVVDRRMATSCRDVYACGDAAEAYDFVHKANRLIPVWPNAVAGGRVAGYNMAGRRARYEGSTSMNALNCFGLSVVAAGLVDAKDDPICEVLAASSAANGTYHKIVLKNNRILGMIFVGDIERSGVVFGLMKDGVNVRRFKEALLSVDFSLSALPEELRRSRLSLTNDHRGSARRNGG
ncbi:MAG: NAD(P)/FAD-dependent oxidoreductase [Dehalococcoidia bacterium]